MGATIEAPSKGQLAELVRAMHPGAALTHAWPLEGGVSAQTTAIEYKDASGKIHKAVVRQHGQADLTSNPDIPRDEFKLLQIVRHHGVAAPEALWLDTSLKIFPSPILVEEFIDGEPVFDPDNLANFLEQAASELTRIHSILADVKLNFLPRHALQIAPLTSELDDTMSEGLIRETLMAADGIEPNNPQTLLHGDYWPGNWLWRDAKLQAVIDWEDAGIGDPLSDLANCRLELLWAFGASAMEIFTQSYLASASIDPNQLPLWDLWAALRPCGKIDSWGLEPAELDQMRRQHRKFVEQAVTRIHDAERRD